MTAFQRIIRFKRYTTYDYAREIADNIVVALMDNDSQMVKDYPPTYVSSVREHKSFFVWLYDVLFNEPSPDDSTSISRYVIEVYRVLGNRKSKLSISQNEKLREIIFKEYSSGR